MSIGLEPNFAGLLFLYPHSTNPGVWWKAAIHDLVEGYASFSQGRWISKLQNDFNWEKTSKVIYSNTSAMGRGTFNWSRLLRTPSSLAANTSRAGTSTTSLYNLVQCFTNPTVKRLFLIYNVGLPSFSALCPITTHTDKKSLSLSLAF